MEFLYHALGIFFLILMGLGVYISSHINHEQKTGKSYPLFWEKDLNEELLKHEGEKFRKALAKDDEYN
jgi:hypothetical protein